MYRDAKSCIMTNGIQSEYFDIGRGIRQGDSLSALLYIIQFEPLSEMLRTSTSIEGISVKLENCNGHTVNVRGCQYVDDSNTMLKSVEYINNFLDIINEYERVSGSKMNRNKTVGLTKNNQVDSERNDIRLTVGPEKVLGILIGNDKDTDHDLFWESLMSKMKSKLDIWRSRDLSLEGKTYLIQSIAISQILYAIEMKEISENYIKSIDNILWNFLWSAKKCTINKSICTLPRNQGGLGLIDLKTVIKVKRIKWVIKVLKDKNKQNWAQLIENYLRCLDNKFGIDFFALKVTDSSDLIENVRIPEFYKSCICFFQELCLKGRCNKDEDEIIWCNDAYRFNGKTISFSHWSRSGIQTVSQLYNRGVIIENELLDKLIHKSGFMFEITTIKKVMPECCAQGTESSSVVSDSKDDILQYEFMVPGLGVKCLKDLDSKDIYNILLFTRPFEIKSKHYWRVKFREIDIEWGVFYQQSLTNRFLPRKCKDFNWKIFHGLVNTEKRLSNMKYSDGICKLCNTGVVENLEHLLINCRYNLQLWKRVEIITNNMFEEKHKIDDKVVILGFLVDKDTKNWVNFEIANMLLSICRYHIWKMRNNVKYGEKDDVGYTLSAKFLRYDIESHIQVLSLSGSTNDDVKHILSKVMSLLGTYF